MGIENGRLFLRGLLGTGKPLRTAVERALEEDQLFLIGGRGRLCSDSIIATNPKLIWESGALRPTGVPEICVALPTRTLKPGSFSLVLSRADEMEPQVVSYYWLALG